MANHCHLFYLVFELGKEDATLMSTKCACLLAFDIREMWLKLIFSNTDAVKSLYTIWKKYVKS